MKEMAIYGISSEVCSMVDDITGEWRLKYTIENECFTGIHICSFDDKLYMRFW